MINLLIVIGSLLLGGSVGFFFGDSSSINLSFDRQINLVELGNLIFLVFLSVFIPFYVNTHIDNKRCEKDLLISDIHMMCNELENIDECIKSSIGKELLKEHFNKINSLFKRSRVISDEIKRHSKDLSSKKIVNQLQKFETELEHYWILVTGDAGIKPQGFNVSLRFFNKQNTRYLTTARAARSLRFTINSI